MIMQIQSQITGLAKQAGIGIRNLDTAKCKFLALIAGTIKFHTMHCTVLTRPSSVYTQLKITAVY